MSLKDEIEKLIQSEQRKIDQRDQKHAEYHERHQQRFTPLRSLIEELVAAVDSNHIESRIFDDHATLGVGRKKNEYFSSETQWEIQPDYDVSFGVEKGQSLFQEKPGFRVEETNYYDAPEYDVIERTHRFATEQETAEYLIKQIAEKMAHYRHLAELVARHNKSVEPPNNGLEEDAP
jgi:hypothetical protein